VTLEVINKKNLLKTIVFVLPNYRKEFRGSLSKAAKNRFNK
jgi:hypothetical protein